MHKSLVVMRCKQTFMNEDPLALLEGRARRRGASKARITRSPPRRARRRKGELENAGTLWSRHSLGSRKARTQVAKMQQARLSKEKTRRQRQHLENTASGTRGKRANGSGRIGSLQPPDFKIIPAHCVLEVRVRGVNPLEQGALGERW